MMVSYAVRPLSKEITMSQAYQNMCAGMYKVGCWYTFVAPTATGRIRMPLFLSVGRLWWLWIWTGRCEGPSLNWTASRFATSIALLRSTAWSLPHLCTTFSLRYSRSRSLGILIPFSAFVSAKLQFLYPAALLPALSRRCLIWRNTILHQAPLTSTWLPVNISSRPSSS